MTNRNSSLFECSNFILLHTKSFMIELNYTRDRR